jgi:2-haloacid dehalogenase
MNRRQFVSGASAGIAAGLVAAGSSSKVNAASRIGAIAFDGFVIFDPRSVAVLTEELFPGKGSEFANAWRTRQFEYTWQRTLTGSYVDFRQVTDEALTFAAKMVKLNVTGEQRDRLMGAFLQLRAWPDVLPTLTAFKKAGIQLALLTDFGADMIEANIRSAGLEGLFGEPLSTDRVRAFKPDPRAYQLGVDSFKLKREEIVFAAFGGWDAAGAKRFGYPTFWCNRFNLPIEELGVVPDRIGPSTVELAEFVKSL